MPGNSSDKLFVTFKTEDRALLDMQKRIDKLSLIQIWVMKANSLFDRYLRTLDKLDLERDPVEQGRLIEEIEICFMSSVSYFLRGFMDQKGSFELKLKNVTNDPVLISVFESLKSLRDHEYVHWKGARSSATVTYSFEMAANNTIEFGKEVRIGFKDKIGPSEQGDGVKRLFEATLVYIEGRRSQELDAVRKRLAHPEAWEKTNLYNEAGQPILKRQQ